MKYSNYYRSSASESEVILGFGLHAYHHDANGPEPIRLTHRLVLPWNTARALCRGLHHLLQQHEKAPWPPTLSAGRWPRHRRSLARKEGQRVLSLNDP